MGTDERRAPLKTPAWEATPSAANKQLLDVVFVISGIIKVKVSVNSRAEGRG